MWIDIDSKDWGKIRSLLQYVIDREGSVIDACMVQYLREELSVIDAHIKNEQEGVPGGKATGIAQQIGVILPFISSACKGHEDE